MRETMKIIADIGVKLNNYDSLYHAIWGFLNRKQGEDEPNKSFKLRFENFYNTMEITGGYKNPALKYSSRMGDRNQWSKNKHKLTRSRKCVFSSVRTRRGTISYSRSLGTGTTLSGINILLQSHRPWIYWSQKKTIFMGVKIHSW